MTQLRQQDFPRRAKGHKSWRGPKSHVSYLTKPEKEGPTLVRQEINDVNVSAENYINQVRRKIWKDANTTTPTTSSAKCFNTSSIVK